MIRSLCYSGRNISERYENSFVKIGNGDSQDLTTIGYKPTTKTLREDNAKVQINSLRHENKFLEDYIYSLTMVSKKA